MRALLVLPYLLTLFACGSRSVEPTDETYTTTTGDEVPPPPPPMPQPIEAED